MAKVATKAPWTDAEHDFLVECAKSNVPYDWVDRVIGRAPRTASSHAKATGMAPSKWNGRISYQKARELRAKFAIICSKHKRRGLRIKMARVSR